METQSTKRKPGRPKKTESVKTEVVKVAEKKEDSPFVLDDYLQLDSSVARALNSGVSNILVTSKILKYILMNNYKDDAYMIYKNVRLTDVEKAMESEIKDAMSSDEKVFGGSKEKIGPNATVGSSND